ncbi:hypothetical protein GCM10023213_17050 [Prosthecobacter algae]|uniref:Terminase small subunit n=1 Tax=Prosthecobacter algae TaxID=1144682 RepID=A0ABP9P0L4_9BACT
MSALSTPPLTLRDPRHEAFAFHLASGHSASAAYLLAGFSPNNARTRAKDLATAPSIRARTAHLKTCLPHITELRNHHAPSLLLMPETQEQMLAWLWQVISGARTVLPIQLRAATLFCRLRGWHLAKNLLAQPQPEAAPLSDEERHILATFSRHTAANDLATRPTASESLVTYTAAMADLALLNSSILQQSTENAPAAVQSATTRSRDSTSPDGETAPQQQPVNPQLFTSIPSPNGEKGPPHTTPTPAPILRPRFTALRSNSPSSSTPHLFHPSLRPPKHLRTR